MAPIDLVLLDINMPAIDGWAVVQAFTKAACRWPDMRIYMLTSSASPEDRPWPLRPQGQRLPDQTSWPDQARQLVGS